MPKYTASSLASAVARVSGDIQLAASTRFRKAAMTLATMAWSLAFCAGGRYRSA